MFKISVTLFAIGLIVSVYTNSTREIHGNKNTNHQNRTVTVIGVGDIMPGTDFPNNYYLPPNKDCFPLFKEVKNTLNSADVTFGNLEGVLVKPGQGKAKHCNNPKQCFVFRIPPHYIRCIKDAGFDLLSIANNHVSDFGPQGRIHTSRVINESGLYFAGLTSQPYTIFEKDNIKYGFCAFSPHSGTCSIKDIAGAKEIVKILDSKTDIIIVSFHGGAEGAKAQHVTRKDELFYGHNRGNVYKFSHAVIDAGADIVFGHGPHVIRAMELYKNRLICYSLGNFCTYRRFNLSGPNGIAPIVKATLTASGEFIQANVTSIVQPGEGGPKLDANQKAFNKLKELTLNDFPETKLDFSELGIVKILKQ